MPEWNVAYGGYYHTIGANLANSAGVNISGSNANTVGSWVELTGATPFQSSGLIVNMYNPTSAIIGEVLVDIGIGADGSEVVIAKALQSTGRSFGVQQFILPIPIPAGSRISARCQSAAQFHGLLLQLIIQSGNFMTAPRLGRMFTMGENEADSGGTSIDPGSPANSKGSYTQIVASAPGDIQKLLISFGNGANNARSDASWLVDVAVGGAGSEIPILINMFVAVATQTDTISPAVVGPFDVYIPAGSRISVRAQCSISDAADRLLDVILYGVEG